MVTKRVFLVVKSGIVPCVPKKNPDPYAIPEQPHQTGLLSLTFGRKNQLLSYLQSVGKSLICIENLPYSVQLPQKQNHCR